MGIGEMEKTAQNRKVKMSICILFWLPSDEKGKREKRAIGKRKTEKGKMEKGEMTPDYQ